MCLKYAFRESCLDVDGAISTYEDTRGRNGFRCIKISVENLLVDFGFAIDIEVSRIFLIHGKCDKRASVKEIKTNNLWIYKKALIF